MDNKQEKILPDSAQPEAEPLQMTAEEIMDQEIALAAAEEADVQALDDAQLAAFLGALVAEDTPAALAPEEDLWENQAVEPPVLAEEIIPDEQAVAAAGLTHPEDLEFEQILAEVMQEDAQQEADGEFRIPEDLFLDENLSKLPERQSAPAEEVAEEVTADSAALEETDEIQEQTDNYVQEDSEMDEEETDPRTPSKRRPKNKSTYGLLGIPHLLTTVIWLAIIVFIGAGLGRMIWQVAADMLAFGRPNQAVTITITSNDDLDDIAQKLYDTGLIKYPGIFKFYGQLANAEKKVKPGTYELNTVYDYNALVKNMAGTADRVSTKVTIPEGYTCAQIFRLLEKSGVCTVEALQEAAMTADLSNYWFLEGIDRSSPNCLEGYLFPDTYEFYLDHNPTSVLKKMLSNFNKRFSDNMIAKIDELNEMMASTMRSHGLSESYIKAHMFTVRDVVIVASMIEKETSGDEESYYISSVIYNRLTNPGEYPYLNIDATLVYITGNSPLTQEDLKFDSPYNTYLYKGMIPGPISNPGLSSLSAALSPENTSYYYYALNPATGSHEFFKTYKAHQNFLESLKSGN